MPFDSRDFSVIPMKDNFRTFRSNFSASPTTDEDPIIGLSLRVKRSPATSSGCNLTRTSLGMFPLFTSVLIPVMPAFFL